METIPNMRNFYMNNFQVDYCYVWTCMKLREPWWLIIKNTKAQNSQ